MNTGSRELQLMTSPTLTSPHAGWRDYIALARPSHWTKHVFIVPGIVLAALLHEVDPADLLPNLVVGFLSAACLASANYVLNEWLDARFDAFHPVKSSRPAVAKTLSPAIVAVEYLALLGVGLALAATVSQLFFVTAALFVVGAWIYNVEPLRTKDRAVLDIVTESFNNPLRLTLGWAMVDSTTLPPSSLLLAFWAGGAFLMTVKRLAEYRTVAAEAGEEALARYRRSFRFYNPTRLITTAFVHAQLAAFFLAVFLVKYRIEYLLTLPLLAALFGSYLAIGLKERSPAQAPERLFREPWLMAILAALVLALAVLTVVDLPGLHRLMEPHYIEFPR